MLGNRNKFRKICDFRHIKPVTAIYDIYNYIKSNIPLILSPLISHLAIRLSGSRAQYLLMASYCF